MSDKLPLFPQATAVDDNGNLTLRGHRAIDLVARFGTPLYLYDVGTISSQISAYRRGLADYSGLTRLTYASKAFQCTALARLMTAEGVGLDVASAGEIFIALNGGADPLQMHMHGNNKSSLDLKTALEAGVGRIVVDNTGELDLLAHMAIERRQHVKIWLRITPGVSVDTHRFIVTGAVDSKFGFQLGEVDAVAGRILNSPEYRNLQLTGLHMHLGSHFHDAEPVAVALERLITIAKSLRENHSWDLEELCAGGGWGVRYHPDDPPMPVEPFVSGVVSAVEHICRNMELPLPTLILEPGRSLVAQAGVVLYTIGGRKVIPDVRTYVSVDGGLADNPRPALYQARYTALLANRADEPDSETAAIAGQYCESGDLLIQAVDLPTAAAGDLLAVPVAGAYHLAMGSNYNAALKPAVVFIENNDIKLVQRRESFEDLVSRDK